MSPALLNAVLVVGFLAVYVMAGEALVSVRRHRRRRLHSAHGLNDPHWTLSAADRLPHPHGKASKPAA